MNLKNSIPQIEIDFNLYRHTYSKNVSMIIFPMDIAKIERAMVYVEINGYRHPVIVNNNHFTLPKELQQITEKERNKPQKNRLLSIIPEDGYYYFLGSFIDGKKSYFLTVDKKIRETLGLKERDVIEIRVKNNIFYSRVWWRSDKKSMVSFFPGKIFEMMGLKPSIPYQIKIKKSERTFVSNDHFYSANKTNLDFNKFLKSECFNLHEFLKNSYARTEGGKIRKFRINRVGNKMLVCYMSGGPESKEVKIKSTFVLNSEFFRMMGLIQAECLKTIKKTFCFTNETPENVKYIIRWFEKYLNFSRESWLYELSVDSRIGNPEEIKNMWANFLRINSNFIKVYPKKFDTKELNEFGVMDLRSYGRTLKEIIMRLLECTRDYVSKNEEPAGHFLSGILAGDGFVTTTKEGSLNYIGISFDPNRIKSELEVYISCLKTLGIPNDDIKICINDHEKAKEFIRIANKYGVKIKVYKKDSKGFGGVINIFKFRSFQKLARFDPFFTNKINVKKFVSSFNKIDRNRVRFL